MTMMVYESQDKKWMDILEQLPQGNCLRTEVSDYGEKLSKMALLFPETEGSRDSFQCM